MKKKSYYGISPKRSSSFFLSLCIIFLFPLLSCTKVLDPKIESINFTEFTLTENADISTDLIIKIYNPNDFDIKLTLKNLRHFKNDEMLGYLLKEKTITLPKKESTIFSIKVGFKKKVFMDSIFSFLASQDINITIKGEIVVHHWTGDHDISFEKNYPINLKNLFK